MIQEKCLALLQSLEEFEELKEVIEISKTCHYYGISREEEELAIVMAKNPMIIDDLIERVGYSQPIPSNQIKHLLTKYSDDPQLALKIAEAQVDYWEKKAMKMGLISFSMHPQERDLFVFLFLFYLNLEQVTDFYCFYSFNLEEEA